jgi:hypothetical protein
MERIPVVIIGFGKMGAVAYQSILRIAENLRNTGIEAELCGVVEADANVVNELPALMGGKAALVKSQTGADVPLHVILRREFGLNRNDRFVAYDAAPTYAHSANLVDVCENFPLALYLGEKPLLTCRNELGLLDRFMGRVACDFVENLSLPLLKIREMQNSGLVVQKLRFWRLNSTGLLKLLLPDERCGVTGGALFDKAIHDLAATSLLMRDAKGAFVEDASIFSFMPSSGSARGQRAFMNARGTVDQEIFKGTDGKWTADAAGFAKARWIGGSGTTPCDYAYSWVGIEQFEVLASRNGYPSLREAAAVFGVDESLWMHRESADSGLVDSFEKQEVRLAIIDGEQDGKAVQLLVNFLHRPPGVEPFVFDRLQNKFLDLRGPEFGENSLCRVFETAIRSYALDQSEVRAPLGGRVVGQSHRALFDIRDYAFAQGLSKAALGWDDSVEVIGVQVKNKYRPCQCSPSASFAGSQSAEQAAVLELGTQTAKAVFVGR